MTRCANHAPWWSGIHSAASRAPFWERFTVGSAIVRLSRSLAKARALIVGDSAVVRFRQRNDVLDVGRGPSRSA